MIVFLIVALVFGGLAVFAGYQAKYLERVCTEEVKGTVTKITQKITRTRSGKHSYTKTEYFVTARFTYGGKTYIVSPGMPVAKDRFKKGQSISVMVNPDDISDYYIEGQLRGYRIYFWLLLTASGIFFLVTAIGFVRLGIYKRAHPITETDWIEEQMNREHFVGR